MTATRASGWSGLAILGAAAATGLLAFAVSNVLAGLSLKMAIAALMGLGALTLGVVSGYPRAVFLALWTIALTYNRQYFVGGVFRDLGPRGPYLIVADVILIGLFLSWGFDLVRSRRLGAPKGETIWPWYAPFLIACALSMVLARSPEAAFFELLRPIKIGLILLYARYRMGPVEWWACVAGFGLSTLFQAGLGVAEVVTGRAGLMGVLGLSHVTSVHEQFAQESFYGWRRATGTMSHPPELASYLLMTVPVFLALVLTARARWLQTASLAVSLVGLAGLACTLSRWPWALMAGQGALVLAGLVVLRRISLKQALGLTSVAVFALLLGLAPMTGFLLDRVTRDLGNSVDFRVKENTTGLKIAMTSPLTGVGLNNYREHLLDFDPKWKWAIQYEQETIDLLHVRPIPAPHNGYLFLFAETGLLGLLTFALYLWGVALFALRAMWRTRAEWQAASLGLTVGIVGLLLQQLIDFSLWVDPLMFQFALVVGLLATASDLATPEQRATVSEEAVATPRGEGSGTIPAAV